MNQRYIFESERLGFRLWSDEDRVPFSNMNADSKVMQFFTKTLTKEESDKFIVRIMDHFERYGFGLWAVEVKETQRFIGFIGFLTATFESDFTPCVEIGWRLDYPYWNKGYATEGAKRCLDYGFNVLGLSEVYSFTSRLNEPSINVMKKIGLKEKGTFLHPNVSIESPLREHVLYKIDQHTFDEGIHNEQL